LFIKVFIMIIINDESDNVSQYITDNKETDINTTKMADYHLRVLAKISLQYHAFNPRTSYAICKKNPVKNRAISMT
jgi:hypothetical protein